jgi:tetratricopeptide (TPR) repeat protein
LRRVVEWNPQDEERNWRSLARAHQALGQHNLSRNQVNEAMAQYREAEEIITRLVTAEPGNLDLQVNLLRTQRQMGSVLMYRLADAENAQRQFRKAIEISRSCLAQKPDSDTYKSELANSLGLLARSEATLGHLEKARELYKEEFGARASFSPASAKVWENRRELAGHYADFATLNVRLADLVEGQRLYDKCTELREQIASQRPGSWPELNDLALSYNNQASMFFPQGSDPAAARKFHQKALDLFKKRAKDAPLDFDTKHMLELTLYYEATCALQSGDKKGAAAGYHQCLAICKELATQPNYKHLQADLMLALARCGDHAQAAKIAAALVATPPKDESLYVQSACGYALAAGAAGGDAALVASYTAAAVDCLRKAKERGWTDVARFKTDTDLEPIRNDPAFQALLGEFRRPGEKRP